MPCVKIKYKNRKQAALALRVLRGKGQAPMDLRAYSCSCGFFHLGKRGKSTARLMGTLG